MVGGAVAPLDGAIGGCPGVPAGGWLCDQFHAEPVAAGGGCVPGATGCVGAAGGG